MKKDLSIFDPIIAVGDFVKKDVVIITGDIPDLVKAYFEAKDAIMENWSRLFKSREVVMDSKRRQIAIDELPDTMSHNDFARQVKLIQSSRVR
jgi:hypothetical protein